MYIHITILIKENAFLQVRSSTTGNTLNAMAIGMANTIDTIQIPDIMNFDTYFVGFALFPMVGREQKKNSNEK